MGDGTAGDLRDVGHAEVGAGCPGGDLVELVEFLTGAVEADLQAVDFAEPAFSAGFGDAGVQGVANLDQPGALGGIGAQQRAAQTGLSELDHSSRYVRFWGHRDGVRPAKSVKVGVPSWMVLVRRRRVVSIWASLSSAPARLTLSPSTSPSQPSRSASAMRACRLPRISSSRARCAGSARRSGHLTQACSWTQGVA